FQNFATDSFASILSEARKYRLNLLIAHQYIGQLVTDVSTRVRDAVFGNVGTIVAFRVGADDAEFLEKEYEPEFTIQDLVNLPNYYIVLKLMVDGITSRPFSATTLPPLATATYEQSPEKIIKVSRERYARPREQVEEKIRRWSGMAGEEGNMAAQPSARERTDDRKGKRAKFEAVCSNCGKTAYLNFNPDPTRPVYCSACLEKIKSGEIKPVRMTRKPEKKVKAASPSDLSALGIEFEELEKEGVSKQKPMSLAELRPEHGNKPRNRQVGSQPGTKKEVNLEELRKILSETIAKQKLFLP
ncbi:MAG: CxxC-x17-CxxC domain-containing protein, partial [Candidatus Paceibacteria bacterium]